MNNTILIFALSLAMFAGAWLLFQWAIKKVEKHYVKFTAEDAENSEKN